MSNIAAERAGVIPVGRTAPKPAIEWLEPTQHRRHTRLRHAPDRPTRSDRIARAFDVVGASIGLLLGTPIMIVVAAMISVSSRGPVVFKHERLGRDLEPFHCLKFRTMKRDSERILDELRRNRPDVDDEFSNSFKLRNDPRITRLGRILRKTSLDELPQLVNVLRGEMSLVGPRPIIADESAMYGTRLRLVLSVRPGMTGAWQVGGRNEVDYPERVDIDVDYVNRKSTIVDMGILLKTPAAVLDWDATS